MRPRLLQAILLVCFCSVSAAILFPTPHHNRNYARRMSCQSNLKQIGLALRQYAQDNDEHLPPRAWAVPLAVYSKYVKFEQILQCPETDASNKTSDYFFNARFVGKPFSPIKSPTTLILFGDGQDNAPLDATLPQLPAAWRSDENSPSWRHLGTANYLFADGHVKAIKAKGVSKDFRMVKP